MSIAERFNRTQKSILYRYEMADDRHKWPDFVHEFNAKYNDTKHSTLGMTPNEAFASKQKEALMRNAKRYYKPRPAAKKPTPTLKPGDRVRIVNVRDRFAKGCEESWSREVFQVLEVKKTNPLTYIVGDDDENRLPGGYYAQELLLARSAAGA